MSTTKRAPKRAPKPGEFEAKEAARQQAEADQAESTRRASEKAAQKARDSEAPTVVDSSDFETTLLTTVQEIYKRACQRGHVNGGEVVELVTAAENATGRKIAT